VIAIHPLVDFRFAFKTRNVDRLDTRTFGPDIPVALGNSHRFETYSCFGHWLLWQIYELKSKGVNPPEPGQASVSHPDPTLAAFAWCAPYPQRSGAKPLGFSGQNLLLRRSAECPTQAQKAGLE
jgi:hypothetical protein